MNEFKVLFETLQQSIKEDQFVKLTLSKPLRKSEGLLNVYVRFKLVNAKYEATFKYRYTTEEQFKQFSLGDAICELEKLLMESFRAGTLFTLSKNLLVMVSKKKKVSYLENAPSFKNKLPEFDVE